MVEVAGFWFETLRVEARVAGEEVAVEFISRTTHVTGRLMGYGPHPNSSGMGALYTGSLTVELPEWT